MEVKEKAVSREKMISDNLGLVHSCANRFRNKGVEYDDLFQAGCVGLIKAADGFDESRGFAFSTYAVPVILGEIRRIFRDGGAIKIGRAMKEKSRELLKEKEKLSLKLGREPTLYELSEHMNLEPTECAGLLTASMPPVSLTSQDDDGEHQLDIPTEPPEEKLSDAIAVREVMARLPEKDKKLIELRYFKGMTQTRIAEELGMSQVQVSRREKTLLAQLRKNLSG